MKNNIPLSLYIHIPWCVKKCPYCDFNSYSLSGTRFSSSHKIPETIETAYIEALRQDLEKDLPYVQGRKIQSIFFGGGTPSLFSAKSIGEILENCEKLLSFESNLEITLEANPGTVEHSYFKDYRLAGITRISLGAQSFQNDKLEKLGRIHKSNETEKALENIIQADFKSFNIDLMYGLPSQSLNDALFDLKSALSFDPPHLSWYHLTIEPNTIFHHQKPILPPEEFISNIEEAGRTILENHGLSAYEISAYCKINHRCQHNLNYWQFGDYLGIGAGAHGKITNSQMVSRYTKIRTPKDYLKAKENWTASYQNIPTADLPLEFMLNALRLTEGTSIEQFTTRTGLPVGSIAKPLNLAQSKNLLTLENQKIIPTVLGHQYLNTLIALF